MIILVIKTDKPKAELSLYSNVDRLSSISWQAQGNLADTINMKMEEMLNKSSISLSEIKGIVCFQGPGSFTGLRIGLSMANALAYAQNIPIVATRGEDWVETGIKQLHTGQNQKIVTPYYDRPAAVTMPKNNLSVFDFRKCGEYHLVSKS